MKRARTFAAGRMAVIAATGFLSLLPALPAQAQDAPRPGEQPTMRMEQMRARMMEMHMRMMSDSVIHDRVMADTAVARMHMVRPSWTHEYECFRLNPSSSPYSATGMPSRD